MIHYTKTIMNDDTILQKLHAFYKNNRTPHTIFYGSVLSNKNEVMLKFLKKIYPTEKLLTENVMFVNCAHGKGIRFIRDEIRFFAKTNVQPRVQFKSVVLLNADHLTTDAQSALRRCIEQFSNHTRFFIVVENKNRLLTPILSRFCLIHIPDTKEKKTDSQYSIEKINCYLEKYKDRTKSFTYAQIAKTCTDLYAQAFSTNDIVQWLQKQSSWSDLEKANVGFYYTKIRSEFRSEKLLMLVILCCICNYPDVDINTICFM